MLALALARRNNNSNIINHNKMRIVLKEKEK